MLIGQFVSTITEKERVAFPAKFRGEIGKRIIIAKWYEGCLVAVSEKSWETLLSKIKTDVQLATMPVRETERFILGSAFEIELDSLGRFVVPKALREYAKMNKEIVFIGLSDRIEIWDKATWNKKEAFLQEHAGNFIEELAK